MNYEAEGKKDRTVIKHYEEKKSLTNMMCVKINQYKHKI